MLSVIKDVNSYYLKNELWSGAINTFDVIAENNKLQDLMFLLEELFPEPIGITAINDFLWFDAEVIYAELDIEIDGE